MWAAENLSISSKPKFSIGQAFARWFPTPQLLAPRSAGIDISENGWDDESTAYPHVFELDSAVYMMYLGNQVGRFGFGLAQLENYTA